MRSIDISTDVFAKIWSLRVDGEESENQILRRVLGLSDAKSASTQKRNSKVPKLKWSKPVWRDDVHSALEDLGGVASLREIYAAVRKIRLAAGRSLPVNLDAIVRRELEYNSSDASAFTGTRDWFHAVDGIGAGRWALRKGAEK